MNVRSIEIAFNVLLHSRFWSNELSKLSHPALRISRLETGWLVTVRWFCNALNGQICLFERWKCSEIREIRLKPSVIVRNCISVEISLHFYEKYSEIDLKTQYFDFRWTKKIPKTFRKYMIDLRKYFKN